MLRRGVNTTTERTEAQAIPTLSDAELVAAARRGDADAHDVLVRRYQRDALRTAAAIAGLATAEDVTQEAFVRCFRSLDRFRTDAPFRPWLLAIVANVARNHRRSSMRWTRATERHSALSLSADWSSPVEDHALARDRAREIHAAFQALPWRLRDVVACRYLLDLSERETATVLAIPPGTVKSRLSRALDQLEQCVPEEVLDD